MSNKIVPAALLLAAVAIGAFIVFRMVSHSKPAEVRKQAVEKPPIQQTASVDKQQVQAQQQTEKRPKSQPPVVRTSDDTGTSVTLVVQAPKAPVIQLPKDSITIENVVWKVGGLCTGYEDAVAGLPPGYVLPSKEQLQTFRDDEAVKRRFPRFYQISVPFWTRDKPDIAPWRWVVNFKTGEDQSLDGEAPACVIALPVSTE